MSTASHTQGELALLGKTVVVIGGSLGIGLETARQAREAHWYLSGISPRPTAIGSRIASIDTPLSASLLGDELENRRNQLRATLAIRRVVGPADIAALGVHVRTLNGRDYDVDSR